jgi:hypothetical protein
VDKGQERQSIWPSQGESRTQTARCWGQAPQYHEHDGDIRQHIISDSPMTADDWVANYCMDGKTVVGKAKKH